LLFCFEGSNLSVDLCYPLFYFLDCLACLLIHVVSLFVRPACAPGTGLTLGAGAAYRVIDSVEAIEDGIDDVEQLA